MLPWKPVSLLCVLSMLYAQAVSAPDMRDLNVAAARGWFTGSAVIVAPGSRSVASHGWADAERRIPNAATTQFQIGSLTKQFTAATILLLAEDGRVSLDDHIEKYWPEWVAGHAVTIHQLLNHTSGIVEISRLPDFESLMTTATTFDDYLTRIEQEPLLFTPGTRSSYSNTGYMVLTRVIERASGVPYATVLRTRVLDPLGMTGTGVLTPRTAGGDVAIGYTLDRAGTTVRANGAATPALAGAGAMYSTADDMVRWGEAVAGRTLMRSSSWDRMFSAGLDGYGYGWRLETLNSRRVWRHGGLVPGFASSIVFWPDAAAVVAVLKNHDSLPKIFDPIALLSAVVMGDAWQMPAAVTVQAVPQAFRERLAGRYEASPTVAFEVTASPGAIRVGLGNQPPIEFQPLNERVYRSAAVDADISFELDDSGYPTRLSLTQGGRTIVATKVKKP